MFVLVGLCRWVLCRREVHGTRWFVDGNKGPLEPASFSGAPIYQVTEFQRLFLLGLYTLFQGLGSGLDTGLGLGLGKFPVGYFFVIVVWVGSVSAVYVCGP